MTGQAVPEPQGGEQAAAADRDVDHAGGGGRLGQLHRDRGRTPHRLRTEPERGHERQEAVVRRHRRHPGGLPVQGGAVVAAGIDQGGDGAALDRKTSRVAAVAADYGFLPFVTAFRFSPEAMWGAASSTAIVAAPHIASGLNRNAVTNGRKP